MGGGTAEIFWADQSLFFNRSVRAFFLGGAAFRKKCAHGQIKNITMQGASLFNADPSEPWGPGGGKQGWFDCRKRNVQGRGGPVGGARRKV